MSDLREVIARAIVHKRLANSLRNIGRDSTPDGVWRMVPPNAQQEALGEADAVLAALEAWEPSEAAEDAADEVFHRVFQERVAANKKYRPDANPYAFASASFSVPIFRAMIAAAREEK